MVSASTGAKVAGAVVICPEAAAQQWPVCRCGAPPVRTFQPKCSNCVVHPYGQCRGVRGAPGVVTWAVVGEGCEEGRGKESVVASVGIVLLEVSL